MRKIISFMLIGIMTLALVGCSGSNTAKEEVKDVPVMEVMTAVEKEVEFAANENTQDANILKEQYYIDSNDVEEFVIKRPLMNVHASEVAIIKAKDEDSVSKVKAGVEKRHEDLDKQWEQYLPDQHQLVKDAKIETIGNYVIFIVDAQGEKIEQVINKQLK